MKSANTQLHSMARSSCPQEYFKDFSLLFFKVALHPTKQTDRIPIPINKRGKTSDRRREPSAIMRYKKTKAICGIHSTASFLAVKLLYFLTSSPNVRLLQMQEFTNLQRSRPRNCLYILGRSPALHKGDNTFKYNDTYWLLARKNTYIYWCANQ